MGCDIHMCLEVRDWEDAPNPWKAAILEDGCWDWRNYDLFSWLANVRNYDEERITPISEPRGLPPDVSPEVKRVFDDWAADNHSHSWLLLSEILASSPPKHCQAFIEWLAAIRHFSRLGYTKPEHIRLVFAFDN